MTVSGGLRKLSPRRPSPGGAPPAPGSGGERSARMSLIILVGAAGLVWVGTAGGQGAVQAEVLDEAKRLYLANGCYACHGLEGRGSDRQRSRWYRHDALQGQDLRGRHPEDRGLPPIAHPPLRRWRGGTREGAIREGQRSRTVGLRVKGDA